MNNKYKTGHGFTLIEILVALSIIAIALGALIKTSGNHSNSAGFIKQKTLAHYVAMNELALLQAKGEWPDIGKVNKSTEMAEHEWFWTQEMLKVNDPVTQKASTRVREARLTVYFDDDREQRLVKLTMHLKKTDLKTTP